MKDALPILKKKVKVDTYITFVMAILMFSMAGVSTFNAIRYGMMNADRFEIREVDVSDSSSPEEIGLYIDGELSSLGDESIARSITTPDYTNPKYPFVINKVIEAIRLIFMGLILSVVYAIFCTIQSGSTPFSKKCVNYLRVVALLTILLGVESRSIFIVMLGVVIGMISEIYRYGTALQDDIDSIA